MRAAFFRVTNDKRASFVRSPYQVNINTVTVRNDEHRDGVYVMSPAH